MQIQKTKTRTMLTLVALTLLQCVTTKNTFYYEPDVNRSSLSVNRVAIVPNRLPLNLTDPEKWRNYNWEIAARIFRDKGYDVVDYQTSINEFEKSGLPVEATAAVSTTSPLNWPKNWVYKLSSSHIMGFSHLQEVFCYAQSWNGNPLSHISFILRIKMYLYPVWMLREPIIIHLV